MCEFLERLQVQCSDQIANAGENQNKLSTILIKALPVNIIADLERGLKSKNWVLGIFPPGKFPPERSTPVYSP